MDCLQNGLLTQQMAIHQMFTITPGNSYLLILYKEFFRFLIVDIDIYNIVYTHTHVHTLLRLIGLFTNTESHLR